MLIDAADVLQKLDADRIGTADASIDGGIVRDFTVDRRECTIIYSRCAPDELEKIIRREMALADEGGYTLEWKVYGHDEPKELKDRLKSAGFEPDPVEKFMVIPANAELAARFGMAGHDVRRIDNPDAIEDLVATAAETNQCDPEQERRRIGLIMREHPDSMSVFVAYVDGKPVAGGRIHYRPRAYFAGLYGGRTSPSERNQGHYTALVGARLREAVDRGVPYVFVDALPTSEPILRKRGFVAITDTQPFIYRPAERVY